MSKKVVINAAKSIALAEPPDELLTVGVTTGVSTNVYGAGLLT
jgi:hypothetical protein